jgi:ATP-binding cassette, subfamily B, bacterial
MIRTLRRAFPQLRPYRSAFGLGSFLAVIEVALHLAQPWPLTFVVDRVLTPGADGNLSLMIGGAVAAHIGLAALTSTADYWSTRLLSSAGLHVANDLRGKVFAHLHRLSLGFHGQRRVGDLSNRVTSDTDRTQDLLVQSLSVLLPNLLLVVGMFAVMLTIDPGFTVLALVGAPLVGFAVHRSTARLQRTSRKARAADGAVAALTTESLGAMPLVQAFSLERVQLERFEGLTGESLRQGLRAVQLQARFSPIIDLASASSTGLVLWFGAHRVLDGRMTVGVLLVFLSYLGSLYKPMKALSKLASTLTKGVAAAERIQDVLEHSPDVQDRPGARTAPKLKGAISLRDVTCSYGREPVLQRIDLEIASGETVALVGRTGAGKSTIAALVPRLIDPQAGVVALDGIDVRSMRLADVRAQVSMVLQDTVLLSGSLWDNIALGRPGAPEADVRRAAQLALVDEFAARLPDGFRTELGERGHGLSGGQRQRIAIARAILRDAPILILDEPTSALDAESEELLVAALGNLPEGRTTLVIAHRLATVRRADRIVVIDQGSVLEQGTHDQLVAWGGNYAHLAHLQGLGREVPA